MIKMFNLRSDDRVIAAVARGYICEVHARLTCQLLSQLASAVSKARHLINHTVAPCRLGSLMVDTVGTAGVRRVKLSSTIGQ